jgi:hypothetical protein
MANGKNGLGEHHPTLGRDLLAHGCANGHRFTPPVWCLTPPTGSSSQSGCAIRPGPQEFRQFIPKFV